MKVLIAIVAKTKSQLTALICSNQTGTSKLLLHLNLMAFHKATVLYATTLKQGCLLENTIQSSSLM